MKTTKTTFRQQIIAIQESDNSHFNKFYAILEIAYDKVITVKQANRDAIMEYLRTGDKKFIKQILSE
jgi:hypothetical protein